MGVRCGRTGAPQRSSRSNAWPRHPPPGRDTAVSPGPRSGTRSVTTPGPPRTRWRDRPVRAARGFGRGGVRPATGSEHAVRPDAAHGPAAAGGAERHMVAPPGDARSLSARPRDALLVLDERGTVARWSPEAEQLLGYDAREALGR